MPYYAPVFDYDYEFKDEIVSELTKEHWVDPMELDEVAEYLDAAECNKPSLYHLYEDLPYYE